MKRDLFPSLRLCVGGILLLAGCARAEAVPSPDKSALSCLASKNVIEITQRIRDGLAAGQSLDELRPVQDEVTANGLKQATALYPGRDMYHAYFEYEVARRLKAVQAGLNSADEMSEDYLLLTDTFTRGESCEVQTKP